MILVKDEFLTHAKTLLAIEMGGWEAIGMWLAMKKYAAENRSNGFVPDSLIGKLAGAPKRWRPALDALVACRLEGEDGELGAGLVERAERGWKLHDYLDHANSADEEDARRDRDRERKAVTRGLTKLAKLTGVSAQALRAEMGGNPSSQDVQERLAVLEPVRGQSADSPGSVRPRVQRTSPAAAPTRASARAQPSPTQPDQVSDPTSKPATEPRLAPRPADELAGRLACRARGPGKEPIPREDPLFERLAFERWWPSQDLLDWAGELGLPDDAIAAALADLRANARGERHDFRAWDKRALGYLRSAARPKVPRGPRAAAPQRPPDHGMTGLEAYDEGAQNVG